jgi:predicted Na+-dependent transporter
LLVPLSAARPPVAEEIVQGTFLATNVGAVLSPESAPWLRALGGSLDALTILFLFVLVAVLGSSGRSKASDSALGITVAVCFALWLVVRVGWSLAFGR